MATIDRPLVYNPPLDPYLDIMYEDEDIMVLNKPSTILSVPGKMEDKKDSILYRVRQKHKDAFAVHRLDYGTSGVLVVGLRQSAISALGKQFISRSVKKLYVAWVTGKLEGVGAINKPLILDLDNRPYQKVDMENGKPALTFYEAMYYDAPHNRTFVRLYPQTGRSHQLRVHLASIGHAILGDHLYADDEAYAAAPHLYLHAAVLRFNHPSTDERLTYIAPCPFETPVEIKASYLDEDLQSRISVEHGMPVSKFNYEAHQDREKQKRRERSLKSKPVLPASELVSGRLSKSARRAKSRAALEKAADAPFEDWISALEQGSR